MEGDLHRILLSFALQNAVRHGSVPQAGAVMGAVMSRHPELRPRAKELSGLIRETLSEVQALSPEERMDRLREIAPDLLEDLSKTREHIKELPALEGAEQGVVMRFAPNPSGPLHLGHARAAVLNDEYVKRYGGRYILRIEDTDPKRVDTDAYRMVQEDIEWLGLGITDIVYQSDRFDLYYDLGRQLISLGGAYVCTCENEQFKELKLKKTACPCRALSVEENLELFDKMLAGEFYEGAASVRVKTDLAHPDPAMRDFPAFRILNSPPHPRKEALVYPLMNFSVTVDDHLLGVTHVIRGKDHIANTRRQRFIFEYFGWTPPVYRHYGRMGIEGVVLSTSQMREGIRAGVYQGWDDIRLGTLRALARRGITKDAVRQAMLDIGSGETDISFSWDNLYARNRELVDPVAHRYFFVPRAVLFSIREAPPHTAHALLHPGDPTQGQRTLHFTGEALLPEAELAPGVKMLRLKDLFNIGVEWTTEGRVLTYKGDSLADARSEKAPIIQWLPPEEAVPCTLVTQEGEQKGYCEPGAAMEEGKVVQFERTCFARIDTVSREGIIAYFTHK